MQANVNYIKNKLNDDENPIAEDEKGEYLKGAVYKILASCRVVNLVVKNPQSFPLIKKIQ